MSKCYACGKVVGRKKRVYGLCKKVFYCSNICSKAKYCAHDSTCFTDNELLRAAKSCVDEMVKLLIYMTPYGYHVALKLRREKLELQREWHIDEDCLRIIKPSFACNGVYLTVSVGYDDVNIMVESKLYTRHIFPTKEIELKDLTFSWQGHAQRLLYPLPACVYMPVLRVPGFLDSFAALLPDGQETHQ